MFFILTLLYLELNAFSLVILLLILSNMNLKAGQYLLDKKLFVLLIYTSIAILFLDSGMWLLDGIPGIYMRALNTAVSVLYYILNPLITMLWLCYVDFYIYRIKYHLKKVRILLTIPFAINLVLSVMSAFGNYFFYIDSQNVYHRGRFFYLMGLICLFYLLCSIAILFQQRKKIKKQDYQTLLIFALPPTIGAFIQNFNYGVSFIWVSVTISILIIFLGIQNDQLYRDYLTGLYNRRQLDNFLLTKSQAQGKMLGGMMLDINDFKSINDRLGHKKGDEALVNLAKILSGTFGNQAFVARYGGDEFVVVIEVEDKQELQTAVSRLQSNIESFNRYSKECYELSVSIGFDYCPANELSSFIEHIDNLMYKSKKHGKPDDSPTTKGVNI